MRGNISHGDGVYKSLDGGKTWKNIGLHDSRAIGKVIVNPTNPDIAFVAALGHPLRPKHRARRLPHDSMAARRGRRFSTRTRTRARSTSRSIRTIRIFCSPRCGRCGARRGIMASGGPGSGLYRSNDGGTTWKRLEEQGPAQRAVRKHRRVGGSELRSRLRADRGSRKADSIVRTMAATPGSS